MLIKDMFYKAIDRDIKGVIKVGQEDESNAYQELEEYVVTKELTKHFSDFFEAYKKGIVGTTDKMGVWISGFFGSGKSHFLKILAYLLENKEVMGKKAVDYFEDKIHDSMVLADMKLAGHTPADVILFNIDSKSDSDSKANKDAIVSVFNKVIIPQKVSVLNKIWECKYFCVWELLAPFWCCLLCLFNLVTISFVHYYCYLLFVFYA